MRNFLFLIFLLPNLILAQEIKIFITDASTSNPIPKVQIETNTGEKYVTDEEGELLLGRNISEIIISKDGYVTTTKILTGEIVIIELETEIFSSDVESGIISLSDFDLSDDSNTSDFASGLLSSYNDVFQSIAAYQFGPARFRQRGYDSRNNKILMNGVEVNKIYDGRPQWSNWGGLNDVLRNREYGIGLEKSRSTFGGINGSTNFILRTSLYQKGLRVSYSSTNTSYTNRFLATYSTTHKNWDFTVSVSRRWAEEGHFQGTFYDANSFFVGVENKINDSHSINFSGIFASNRRGKSSPNTQEVYDLQSENYNSYWGWQNGMKRNSRVKKLEEPIFLLTHYWDISQKSNLETSLFYQFGSMGNSRLNYSNGPNPDPSYYRKLPSYYLRNFADRPELYTLSGENFSSNANYYQIDWNRMYEVNINNSENKSVYMLYEDRVDDNLFQFNSVLNTNISESFDLDVGINYKNLTSLNFANSLDLLGGSFYMDVDSYRRGDEAQNNLNQPNRIIGENDPFKYKFEINSESVNLFSNLEFNVKNFSITVTPKISYYSVQRDGKFRNGVYPENSYGKSEKKEFINGSVKSNLEYKITGRHVLRFSGAYISRPPTIRNSFSNSRENNNFVEGIDAENIYSSEATYFMNLEPIKLKLTGYYSRFKNMNEISFFFAQGLAGLEESSDFVSEIMTGSSRDHYGIEFGVESKLSSTVKLSGGVALGEYVYTNNPNLYLTSDDITGIADYGTAYIENYKVPGTPQRGYSLGLEYRDPNYWWVSANGNYLSNNYIDISPIIRTERFYVNPEDPDGFPFANASESEARRLLKQEKFDDLFLLNFFSGKSWKIDNYYIGVILSVNNILDNRYKSGGYEQSRNANFNLLKEDIDSSSRIFGPRYWYGYGRTYYLNVYFRF
ncbi:MAG: TonB-dependent receptor [Flammeovirgaceae bacterium]